MMESTRKVLRALKRHKTRATYRAVGDVIGLHWRNVGHELRVRCPDASWVVNKKTKRPTGYSPSELDPSLFESDRIISTEGELRALLRRS